MFHDLSYHPQIQNTSFVTGITLLLSEPLDGPMRGNTQPQNLAFDCQGCLSYASSFEQTVFIEM